MGWPSVTIMGQGTPTILGKPYMRCRQNVLFAATTVGNLMSPLAFGRVWPCKVCGSKSVVEDEEVEEEAIVVENVLK